MENKPFSNLRWRSNRLDSVSGWLVQVRGIRGPQAAKEFLGLSFSQMGREIARIEGRAEPYRKGTVANWCAATNRKRHRPMTDAQINSVGILIANCIVARSGRDHTGIRLSHNSPWRVTVWARCHCGEWYEVKRAEWHACKRHRGNRQ